MQLVEESEAAELLLRALGHALLQFLQPTGENLPAAAAFPAGRQLRLQTALLLLRLGQGGGDGCLIGGYSEFGGCLLQGRLPFPQGGAGLRRDTAGSGETLG